MNRQIMQCHLIGMLISSFFITTQAYATLDSTQNALAPTGIKPSASPIYNVANVFYVTFRMACPNYNPSSPAVCSTSSNPFFYKCPQGLILVPASGTYVPPIPGADTGLGLDQANYYWQCMQDLGGFSIPPASYTPSTAGNPQPFMNMSYPDYSYAGTLPTVSNPAYHTGGVYATSADSWILDTIDDSTGNTNVTYYQFPGNSFIPTGIGGSGIGCGTTTAPSAGIGDIDTITCTDSFGRQINPIIPASPYWNIPYHNASLAFVFYIPPGSSARCHVVRQFAKNGDLRTAPNCDTYITVPAGQAAVMACCDGTWSCQIGDWSQAKLVTCYQGCDTIFSCPGQSSTP